MKRLSERETESGLSIPLPASRFAMRLISDGRLVSSGDAIDADADADVSVGVSLRRVQRFSIYP